MRDIQIALSGSAGSKASQAHPAVHGTQTCHGATGAGCHLPLLQAKGQDYEDKLADRVRDVAPLKTAKNMRFQPSATMLHLMNRRLARFDMEQVSARQRKGERLSGLIGTSVVQPAQANAHHDYWVFPAAGERATQVHRSASTGRI